MWCRRQVIAMRKKMNAAAITIQSVIRMGIAKAIVALKRRVEDEAIIVIEDPYHQLRVARGVMHGDHIHLKSKGGKDTAENINTLCCRCHMIKTYKEQDYLGNKG